MTPERITHQGCCLAIIVRGGAVDSGIHFVTPDDNALQVGKQARAKGVVIKPHAHCAVKTVREDFLQEVLYIEKGKVKVSFYTDEGLLLTSHVLNASDTILLIQGGHGFEILEDAQMLEVKMGPYDPASKKNIQEKI